MSRLVKAVTQQSDESQPTFDEGRFLQEAGQIAARLQSELTGDRTRSRRRPASESLAREYRDELGITHGGQPPGPDRVKVESSVGPEDQAALRIFEDAQTGNPDSVGDGTTRVDERRMLASLRDSLQAEVHAEQQALENVKHRLRAELLEEQTHWNDRCALESQSLQAQSDKLSKWAEALRERENRLARHEHSPGQPDENFRMNPGSDPVDLTELADDGNPAVNAPINQQRNDVDGELQQREQELSRRREELTRERLEQRDELRKVREYQLQEVNTARAEYERERDAAMQELECDQREWNERYQREQDELLEMRKTVEQDVAQMHEHIERQKADWEPRLEDMRIRMREEELAHEQSVELVRAELSRLAEAERVKLAARREEIEQLERETSDRCEQKRQELEEELRSQRTEWISQQESERTRLEAEKASLKQSVEELQTALDERRDQYENALQEQRNRTEKELLRQREQQEIELASQRQQASEWVARETARIEQERQETRSGADAERKAFEDERAAWQQERGHDAAILKNECHELETERARLESEQDRIEAERNDLGAELESMRVEHNEQFRRAGQTHQQGLLQAACEMQGRQRILDEKVQQTEAELASRCHRVEEELRVMRELHEKQLRHDNDAFAQACAGRDAEIEREKSELRRAHEKFERQRREFALRIDRANQQFAENVKRTRQTFAAESSRVRKQLEQERRVLRSGLNQMNAQLRSVASSIDGAPADVSLQEFSVPSGQPSAAELELMAGRLADGCGDPAADSHLMAHFPILPVEFVDAGDLVDLRADNPPGGESDTASEPVRVDEPEPAEVSQAGQSAVAELDVPASPNDSNSGAVAEWACVVETPESASETNAVERRQALEGYRSQLGELQAQLHELAAPSDRSEETCSHHAPRDKA